MDGVYTGLWERLWSSRDVRGDIGAGGWDVEKLRVSLL